MENPELDLRCDPMMCRNCRWNDLGRCRNPDPRIAVCDDDGGDVEWDCASWDDSKEEAK